MPCAKAAAKAAARAVEFPVNRWAIQAVQQRQELQDDLFMLTTSPKCPGPDIWSEQPQPRAAAVTGSPPRILPFYSHKWGPLIRAYRPSDQYWGHDLPSSASSASCQLPIVGGRQPGSRCWPTESVSGLSGRLRLHTCRFNCGVQLASRHPRHPGGAWALQVTGGPAPKAAGPWPARTRTISSHQEVVDLCIS